MRVNVQKTFVELISYVDFPTIVYINQTGKIIARNQKAELIIGKDSKNVNEIFVTNYKAWYRRGVIEQKEKTFYNVKINVGKRILEIDLQVNVIPYENQNVTICFFEQSYKMMYERNMNWLIPRLFYKDRNHVFKTVNRHFLTDYGVEGKLDFRNEDFIEHQISDFLTESEKEIMGSKMPEFNVIHTIKTTSRKDVFIRLNCIPVLSRTESVEGILGIYTIIMNRDEYKNVFDATLRQKQLLNRIISEYGRYVATWRMTEGWPIEYVSTNFNNLGYQHHIIYNEIVMWTRIIHPRDLARIKEQLANYLNESEEELPVLTYRIRKGNGRYIWIEDVTYTMLTEDNILYREGLFSVLPESCYKELEKKY